MMNPTFGKALAGVRVLDFSWVLTGPICTRILAMLGAEVIKVESRSRPDLSSRDWIMPLVNEHKRSCTIDMKNERGQELARQLVTRSDVVVETFSTGVMERLGLSYETLRELNPRAIIASSSALGRTGPNRADIAYGSLLQAWAGWGALSSYSDDEPVYFGGVWADPFSGTTLAFAVLAALYDRERTGVGKHIDLSMVEVLLSALAEPLLEGEISGAAPKVRKNRDNRRAPQGVYPCLGTDAWVSLSVGSDSEWSRLRSLIGSPGLADDGALREASARMTRHDEIDAVIATWTRGRTADDAIRALQAIGVAAGAVAKRVALASDPQLQARGFFAELRDTDGALAPGLPWRVDGNRIEELDPCPEVGADNDHVFGEILGLDRATIQDLIDARVIY